MTKNIDPNAQNEDHELHIYTSGWEPDGGFVLEPGKWKIHSYGVAYLDDNNVIEIMPISDIINMNVVKV